MGKGKVPCGQCLGCRIARVAAWKMRLLHERSYWEKAVFITLTYDDEHITIGGTLNKKHLQQYFKDLRKLLEKTNIKIKHFSVGEYGGRKGRPHYHSIIFGLGEVDKEILTRPWTKGMCYIGSATAFSMQYVAGYITKKLNGASHKEKYGTADHMFQLQSIGIGKQWALDNTEYLLQKVGLTLNGHVKGMPRYYKKVLADYSDYFGEVNNQRTLDNLAKEYELWEELGIDELTTQEERKSRRAQSEANIKARLSLKPLGDLE